MKKMFRLLPYWPRYREVKKRLEKPEICPCCEEPFDTRKTGKLFPEGAMELHHLTYEREGKEKLEDTIFVCGKCHSNITLFYTRRSRNLHMAHHFLWVGLKACPKFWRRIEMTGLIRENLTEEEKDLIGNAWFIAEMKWGDQVYNKVAACINLVITMERQGLIMNDVHVSQDVPVPEKQIFYTLDVSGREYDVDDEVLNKMQVYLRNKKGISKSKEEILEFVKSRAHRYKVTDAISFDAAIQWILIGIISEEQLGDSGKPEWR